MKRFRNILLLIGQGTDNRQTLEQAVDLAKLNQAQLMVIDVIPKLPANRKNLLTSNSHSKTQEIIVNKRRDRLKGLVEPHRNKGVQIKTKILIGTPFLEVIREVDLREHDLVMLTGDNRSSRQLFCSTSFHLIRKCPCPVWVMKTTRRQDNFRILAAIDLSRGNELEHSTNINIMELVTSLTRLEGGELHILNISSGMEQAIDKLFRDHDLNEIEPKVHHLNGKPEDSISELAEKKGIDLIVIGIVSHTGLAGFFVGNTVERVLQHVNCSVLIMKSEGFISTIKPKGA